MRNIGALDGNRPLESNEWEAVKKAGAAAINAWIASEMKGKDCLAVLVGAETASRPWVRYEIKKAWADGLGVFAVHIHNLKDEAQRTSPKGPNPLAEVELENAGLWRRTLADVAPIHNPNGWWGAYDTIAGSIAGWAEESIRIRRRH